MKRHSVLFLHDPVVALDLAEILSSKLGPMQLYFPRTATEAKDLLKDAVCVVTDRVAHGNLGTMAQENSIPHLYLGNDQGTQLSTAFAQIDEPFTNFSVTRALCALGLVP